MLIDYSMRLFERLGCRDYARFDFRCDGAGEPRLLEVNPNPGWCWHGKFNLMASFEGLRYADLLGMIINSAVERLGLQAQGAAQAPAREQRAAV
jgi:D-alanine-D-alanine ligase